MESFKRLYRFLDASSAIKTIERKMFRVGRITEFNDPFEWRIGLSNYIENAEFIARSAQESMIHSMNSKFGVICFSDIASQSILWSLYADHHRGIALAIDHNMDDKLHRMIYSNNRPTLNLSLFSKNDSDEHAKEVVTKMLSHKSSGWSFEREYRVFADLANCHVSDGHYFLPIPDNFLKKVILGFRCPVDEIYIKRCLQLANLDEVEVVKAKDDMQSYNIIY